MDYQQATAIYQRIKANIQSVVVGKEQTIKLLLAAFFSRGHVLLEDVPGTGKTTLAKALARSIDISFARIQFTPDLLPSDILGVSIYRPHSGEFEFIQGPIFTEILLSDEINRASPRTQSALLEAMEERQITIEGKSYMLSPLFFVIATENPTESHGTYPLPESQMDRFMIQLSPGYLDRDSEAEVLKEQFAVHPLNSLEPVVSQKEIMELSELVTQIRITEELRYYIVDLVSATRKADHVLLGASVRASLALQRIAQALALFGGREFVVPDDINEAATFVLAHRLQLTSQAQFSGVTAETVILRLLEETATPT